MSIGGLPVSARVAGVIEEPLDDAELDRRWRSFYKNVRPRRADIRQAEAILRRMTHAPRRTRAA